MVYTERTDKYLTTAKDNASQSKAASQKPEQISSSGGSSSGSAGAWSGKASTEDKWKYNNMVKNNRDQFNGMHFS
ncbi:uncharacterized protein LOC115631442 [Scaptodrosophila lebanonensis]|uniref:Uncharacterized protein LOC115631442 n=1 Tax=Drosophila lebanonensis TaxID=7225 RepID=A0A6J2U6T3_DROLE|nr:uncharacterized protein LOC115631442 [Scaptodrosophila lebanonensis]